MFNFFFFYKSVTKPRSFPIIFGGSFVLLIQFWIILNQYFQGHLLVHHKCKMFSRVVLTSILVDVNLMNIIYIFLYNFKCQFRVPLKIGQRATFSTRAINSSPLLFKINIIKLSNRTQTVFNNNN